MEYGESVASRTKSHVHGLTFFNAIEPRTRLSAISYSPLVTSPESAEYLVRTHQKLENPFTHKDEAFLLCIRNFRACLFFELSNRWTTFITFLQ